MLVVKTSLVERFNREFGKGGLPVGTVHGERKKVSDNPSKWERVGKEKKMDIPVQHDGEYVLTSNGSKNFGEISPEISKIIGRQAGKIRFRIGVRNDDVGDYGEKHIERPDRLSQLNFAGFNNARDFIEYTCNNFDEIYSSGKRLMLTKVEGGHTCIIELKPNSDGDFYDVITGLICRRKSILNKLAKEKIKLLWQKP